MLTFNTGFGKHNINVSSVTHKNSSYWASEKGNARPYELVQNVQTTKLLFISFTKGAESQHTFIIRSNEVVKKSSTRDSTENWNYPLLRHLSTTTCKYNTITKKKMVFYFPVKVYFTFIDNDTHLINSKYATILFYLYTGHTQST